MREKSEGEMKREGEREKREGESFVKTKRSQQIPSSST
jgi:hypothetical protein